MGYFPHYLILNWKYINSKAGNFYEKLQENYFNRVVFKLAHRYARRNYSKISWKSSGYAILMKRKGICLFFLFSSTPFYHMADALKHFQTKPYIRLRVSCYKVAPHYIFVENFVCQTIFLCHRQRMVLFWFQRKWIKFYIGICSKSNICFQILNFYYLVY